MDARMEEDREPRSLPYQPYAGSNHDLPALTVRGINNPTGMACHLNSALVLLCYNYAAIRDALVVLWWWNELTATLAPSLSSSTSSPKEDGSRKSDSISSSWKFLIRMGQFFYQLSTTTTGMDVVDPTVFYDEIIDLMVGLDPHDLGDAATALVKLLQIVDECLSVVDWTTVMQDLNNFLQTKSVPTFEPVARVAQQIRHLDDDTGENIASLLRHDILGTAKVHSLLVGHGYNAIGYCIQKRTKETIARRPMAMIWTLQSLPFQQSKEQEQQQDDGSEENVTLPPSGTLQELIHYTFFTPRPIQGYTGWDRDGTIANEPISHPYPCHAQPPPTSLQPQPSDATRGTNRCDVEHDSVVNNLIVHHLASAVVEWKTTKQTIVDEYPPAYWLLQLPAGQEGTANQVMIPFELTMLDPQTMDKPNQTMNDSPHLLDQNDDTGKRISQSEPYALIGSILLVRDQCLGPDSEEPAIEPIGHNVALFSCIACDKQSQIPPSWHLVDDHQHFALTQDEARQLLHPPHQSSGDRTHPQIPFPIPGWEYGVGTSIRPLLLVYARKRSFLDGPTPLFSSSSLGCYFQSLRLHLEQIWIQHQDSMRLANKDKLLTTTNNQSDDTGWQRLPPEQCIGRRCRVKWAKDQWYTGIVTSYNVPTRKHTIQYDDGDVRQYRLHQKTLIWEPTVLERQHQLPRKHATSQELESVKDANGECQSCVNFASEETPPIFSWVGRRLRIQWAQGQWFAGVVTKFDAVTGKHTVQYDDGDIRQYRLHQKTFLWE